ncbi:hypothetical protein DCAR_0101535 [Daucus carota subsp. sativus]|uniref:BED-type domain-containing protein n=1 Tax=Daucus carota subsp. sativus TaxID=79200 RepID=A0A166GH01_DAUCS|nr:hypothetical protein DCAR_0101535 [Daucus carota subsp. sativus]
MKDSNDNEANTQASSAKRKRKPIEKRSDVWDHFTKFTDAEGCLKSRCNYCDKEYHWIVYMQLNYCLILVFAIFYALSLKEIAQTNTIDLDMEW